jgi:hypothetical protein
VEDEGGGNYVSTRFGEEEEAAGAGEWEEDAESTVAR